MAVMTATRSLRKERGGEPTGVMALAGARVRVINDKPPWAEIELLDVDGKPRGFCQFSGCGQG